MNRIERLQSWRADLEALLGARDAVRIDNPPWMRLCVERIAPDRISLTHYGEQNGDLMADPDVVFLIRNGLAIPISYQNDYVGIYSEAYRFDARGEILGADLAEVRGLEAFVATWFANLREQGFHEAAARLHAAPEAPRC